MTPPPARFFPPDRRFLAADQLLPLLGAVFGFSACIILWAPPLVQLPRVPLFFGGWFVGLILPRLYAHHGRCLGIAPWFATAAAIVTLVASLSDDWSLTEVGLFSLFEGLTLGAVLRYRDKFRMNQGAMAIAAGLGVCVVVLVIAAFSSLGHADDEWKAAYRWLLLGFVVLFAFVSWINLTRLALEFVLEVPVRTMYRISAAGPGLYTVPNTGPCLIIANHAAWFDPILMGKVISRELTPMMTASFYDIKMLGPLLRLCHVIRVPESTMKRDAKEVLEAIAALDAGRCVLIFPEGYLRRKEDQVTRRFGQGVWQILTARPTTPVVPCWIEGSWGSYFSWFNGPPTRNKKFDFRRQIDVVVNPTITVPKEVLADHLPARQYLMQTVLAARSVLGLPAYVSGDAAKKGEDG